MKIALSIVVLALSGAGMAVLAQDGDRPDPAQQECEARLETLRVTLDFKDAPLEDVISFLRDASDMNFLIDKAARDKGDLRVTIKVSDLPLKNILNLVLKPHELTVLYKDGVWLVTAEGQEELKMEIYDVRDLLFPIQQFPGVDIALEETGAEVLPPPPEPDPEIPIVDLIKAHTGGKSWDENSNTSVSLTNGLLVVKQTRAVHAEVRRMILKLRDFK